ncbi:MAG TPA: hypothetical protein VGS22_28785 [Thermoanaerobaculia bacterium]|jgi:hypothetical protein|nr:hypothetical protein [Thermoanaerobaculia bacterium]
MKRESNGQGVDGLQFVFRAVLAFLTAFAARMTWQRPAPAFPLAGHRSSRGLVPLIGVEGAWRVDVVLITGLALLLFASLVYDALRFFLGERASHWPVIWGRRERYELEVRFFVIVPVVLTMACALATAYVWVDNPGPTDAGRHSLSGWLFDIFGAGARPAGIAIFALLTLLLVAVVLFEMRRLRNWRGVPRLPTPAEP